MRALLLLLLSSLTAVAHEVHPPSTPAGEMATAAQTFLLHLDEAKKKTAHLPFNADERENWHYVPRDDRKGVRLGDLTPSQRPFLFALLDTGLSEGGMLTTSSVMALEGYLARKENAPERRNPEKYFLTVFGQPSLTKTWGWRFEGHHLSLNYTVVDGKTVIYTPIFFGTNPAKIADGPLAGQCPLGAIESLARRAVRATAETHPDVVFSTKPPREILSGQERTAAPLDPRGINTKDLPPPVAKLVSETITAITGKVGALAEPAMGETWFAWAGSTEEGKPHYFRLQADDLLIEYANTQNNANHAHLVIRAPKRDFGRDLLKEHLEEAH